jgi:hypothetical protein
MDVIEMVDHPILHYTLRQILNQRNSAFIYLYSKYHRVKLCRKGHCSHFRVWVMLIIEDPTKTAKSSRAKTTLFLHYNMCASAMFDSLSCSFTSTSFPITRKNMDVIEMVDHPILHYTLRQILNQRNSAFIYFGTF